MNESCVCDVAPLERPDFSWSADELGERAKWHDTQCATLGRKMAVQRYWEGHALRLARAKVPYGQWGWFLKTHGISKSSDHRARTLFARVGSESELEGLEITEAYERHGIVPKKANFAALVKGLPDDDCEPLPDELPELEAFCEQARAELPDLRKRIKAGTASEEERTGHRTLLARWLKAIHKRDQLKTHLERQESFRAAEERRLRAMESKQSESARLLGLLDEGCRLLEELGKSLATIDPSLTDGDEFDGLAERFSELADDLSQRLVPR